MSNDIAALQELPCIEAADLWELDEAGMCAVTCTVTCNVTEDAS
jgi:hypothetical protein